jgi:hypothetical protein
MNTAPDAYVVIQLPGGDAAAFSLQEVVQARRRALDLGFASGGSSISAPATASAALPHILNSRELGALLGVNDTLLETMARDRRIPSLRVGKCLRFQVDAVLAALRPGDTQTSGHLEAHEFAGRSNGRNQKTTRRKEIDA